MLVKLERAILFEEPHLIFLRLF